VTEPSGPGGDPDLARNVDALSRRLTALTDRILDATGSLPIPLVTEVVQELSAAVEEFEVSAQEIQAQNEALAEAKRQLDLESARYRELFDLAPDGYLVTDTSGVIVESNRAASELLGSPGHFLAHKPVIVFVDAPNRREVLNQLHDAVTGPDGRVVAFEAGFAPPNSAPFHAAVHLTVGGTADPAVPRVRWLLSDVSRRAEAERALAASENRYRLIAESAADVVIATDDAGQVTFASPSTTTTLSLEPDAMEGHTIAAFVHPDDWPGLSSLREDALVGKSAAAVYRFRRGDGGYVPMEARVVPFRRPEGRGLGMQYALRDVREREAARAALEQALAREQEAAAVLRDADAAKYALLLAAAHELNTPIATVAGLADLLVTHPDLPEGAIARMAQGLASTGAELRGILTNLLDSERVLGGYVAPQRQSFDIVALVVERARSRNGSDLDLALPSGTETVTLDPELTARIVDNLVSNALRHTPAGTAVEVAVTRRPDGVLLAVEDAGRGIPDAEKEGVFEAFHRRAGSAPGGLGLGLFVVRRFAEIQGGRAWVEDAPGGGAAFRVLLPDPAPEPARR
jgi:PAS domain S-box-containing protein